MKKDIMFETKRLIVKTPSTSDLENLVKLYTDEKAMVFLKGPRTREVITKLMYDFLEHYRLDGFGYGLVYDKLSGEFMGRAGLNRYEFKRDAEKLECGILLFPKYWNSGYATELLEELAKYTFNTLKLPELYATIDEKNIWSLKLATKVGFSFTNEIIHFGEIKQLYVKFNPYKL